MRNSAKAAAPGAMRLARLVIIMGIELTPRPAAGKKPAQLEHGG
jgi:hypothetical protein